MLSYRHAFHAGNFADVLKHTILIQILEHLGKKDKPFCCIDTHAGPGKYELDGDYAQKNQEYQNGIGKLWQRDDLPECVAEYLNLVKRFNLPDKLTRYPGSPLLIKQMLRNKDRLCLFELHSTEIKLLKDLTSQHITVSHGDGLKDSLKLLPPIERRGLVLIDPSYEIKNDYTEVVDALKLMHKRFAVGTYALWYPVINRRRNQLLEKAIQSSDINNVQLFELGIRNDSNEHGMTSSGMIIINPPWTLVSQMQETLPWLAEALGQEGEGFYRIETLVAE
ncbi:MAG: 23S rRNA (adenine(2030)-N(6))-methyltransferase RlmJ [Methylococcaceae bacterium]|jgi:23S rRNA (adenine2030-N6)-methyltransferase|nr:23S rRNA (adenine(2030)-N(6))-methyltransferase RlmJ [Methylococcaceae bacterium]MDZ4155386.1 23S rRNA (adenine(2030)-N(6))-methyltransferase RlmJ [Methylococcales bacterium]MDP2392938.1 23S rRNA (adenine(2030)-N(6))-methyltransferase RlmJ [Methylococcaceae bacterium]MDP3018272.1 23S rRNA (adenine(2030)-N(6))-methyltransferase RlmJ [Methylococcaceae bacterium]MDP3391612.1 23S rRNA (adenine(2030)-N(6))-methyltransferase RlmJ [Methylococcaceae bacterium]